MNYKESLNLPETSFKMRGNLSRLEPEILKQWNDAKLYEKLLEKNKDNRQFILHDGPPYANGHIHMGHVLNKILKDIIVKFHLMNAEYAPYVPGWDCHGLPIEHQVEKELGAEKHKMTTSQIRKLCRDYALKYIDIQRDEFKRLGIFGDWEDPYLTMNYHYEAAILRELGKFVEKDTVYKNKRPVYWCASCETALAEAEVEYHDKKDKAIFVSFDAEQEWKEAAGRKVSVIIWTTTPWTIPANRAVALNPEIVYAIAAVGGDKVFVVAAELLDSLMTRFKISDYKILTELKGRELEGRSLIHPLNGRVSPIVLADYVTTDSGTGAVHTAPGHGADDYQTGLKYGLEIFSPIDDHGKFTKEIPEYEGKTTWDANDLVMADLEKAGGLIDVEKITHSYPHCWRCKSPIIFRATAQWFISMDKGSLRKDALREINNVRWIPQWGKNRIMSMIENRPDWCISRQRAWGVPIALFKCSKCGKYQTSKELIGRVADMMEEGGADIWFEMDNKKLLPEGYKCDCGSEEFEKEKDILDVWFDSGSSHAAVLEDSHWKLSSPADLYLEGSDQHRGWFHSSLLESVGTRGHAPYRAVLTHGFVTDMNGKKMSKSLGNVISPKKIINQYGADILRLWVASSDYQYDIHLSDLILKRLVETYRKLRNGVRFLLGNLADSFDNIDKLLEFDRLILARWEVKKRDILDDMAGYQFHTAIKNITNFCNNDLSSYYFDIIKDRLYCDSKESISYKSAQVVLNILYDEIVHILSPVLCFTSEEAWQNRNKSSVFDGGLPALYDSRIEQPLIERYEKLDGYRSAVRKAIEPLKADKTVSNSLELVIYADGNDAEIEFLKQFENSADLFMVSEFRIGRAASPIASCSIDEVDITIEKSDSEKCERCWRYLPSVKLSGDGLCSRCQEVVDG